MPMKCTIDFSVHFLCSMDHFWSMSIDVDFSMNSMFLHINTFEIPFESFSSAGDAIHAMVNYRFSLVIFSTLEFIQWFFTKRFSGDERVTEQSKKKTAFKLFAFLQCVSSVAVSWRSRKVSKKIHFVFLFSFGWSALMQRTRKKNVRKFFCFIENSVFFCLALLVDRMQTDVRV